MAEPPGLRARATAWTRNDPFGDAVHLDALPLRSAAGQVRRRTVGLPIDERWTEGHARSEE